MRKIAGLGDARPLIQLAQIVREIGIVGDTALIALEVPEVDDIEADQGGEQADVGFGQPFPGEIARVGQPALQ